MGSELEKLFKTGLFKRISADEAECIICTAKENVPKRLSTKNYGSTGLKKHIRVHPEYLAPAAKITARERSR